MRTPTCEGTIKTQKRVNKMSINKIDEDLASLPLEVKKAFLNLALAIPTKEDMDDWECDLGDVIFPILNKKYE